MFRLGMGAYARSNKRPNETIEYSTSNEQFANDSIYYIYSFI